MSCSDYPTASDAKRFKNNADSTNEFVTSTSNTFTDQDGGVHNTIEGISTLAENQRDILDQLAENQRDNFEVAFSSQFNYKRIGNISDYAGQSLPEADKLNSYQFPDNSGDWYAPEQGQTFPITIPVDPTFSGSDWFLQASPETYRGLWPDTGGSANKGETWQTQTGGTPTGLYFTALQNTTVDPVSDDVNWRGVASTAYIMRKTRVLLSDFASHLDADSTGGIESAMQFAIDNNIYEIQVNENYTCGELSANKARVNFLGNGSLDGAYRSLVKKEASPTFRYFDDLSTVALKRFRRTENPVVVFVGDSTYTLQPDVRSRTETVYSMIQNKLRREYPDKDITFHNRAIGGQRWDDADTVPRRAIWWYTDPTFTDPWLDYVEALNPDLVVIGFGMNDGADTSTFSPAAVRSVISKIRAFAGAPDVLVGTNLVPSIGTPQGAYSGKSAQEGRDFVAGYVRSYCLANNVPLLDFNRYQNIVRDGFDVIQTNIRRDGFQDSSDITSGRWLYNREVYDYNVEVYASLADNQAVLDAYNGVNGVFSARIGSAPDDVVFFDNDGGFVRLRFFSGDTNYLTFTTTQPMPTGAVINFFFEVNGNTFTYRSGPLDEDLDLFRTDKLIRSGGLFNPNVGYYQQSDGPLSPGWVTTNYGVPTQYLPSAFDAELWGSPSEVVETRPEGGNGVNHPSSAGAKLIYGPVIDSANWSRPFVSRQPPKSIGSGVTETRPVTCHIKDGVVTLSGVLTTNGNTTLMVTSDNAVPGFSELYTSAVGDSGGGNLSPVALRVSPSGFVQIAAGQATPSVVYLDGASYALNN